MSFESEAPLLEAWFEVKWGVLASTFGPAPVVTFDDTDSVFFPGRFSLEAANAGFPKASARGPTMAFQSPHMAAHRFDTEPPSSVVLQIGLGVLTVNHTAKDYDWAPFKAAILKGLEVLDKSHPKKLVGLPVLAIGLRYQDAFPYSGKERSTDILHNRLSLDITIPDSLWALDSIDKGSMKVNMLSFGVDVKEPTSTFSLEFSDVKIVKPDGTTTPSAIAITAVESDASKGHTIPKSVADIDAWLEQAHKIHQHWYSKLHRAPKQGG